MKLAKRVSARCDEGGGCKTQTRLKEKKRWKWRHTRTNSKKFVAICHRCVVWIGASNGEEKHECPTTPTKSSKSKIKPRLLKSACRVVNEMQYTLERLRNDSTIPTPTTVWSRQPVSTPAVDQRVKTMYPAERH